MRHRLRIHAAALLFLLGIAACVGEAPKRRPIRIGLAAFPSYEYVALAHRQGFFRSHGFDVDLVDFAAAADVRSSFERGQIDVFLATVPDVLMAADRTNREPAVVFIVDDAAGVDVIVGKDMRTPEDLEGKRVGLEPGSLGLFVLARALERSGLWLDKVTVVAVRQSRMVQALENGDIDAAVLARPVRDEALGVAGTSVLFSTKAMPHEILDLAVCDRRILDEHPGFATAFAQCFDRAKDWARANPETAVASMSRRLGMTPEAFVKVVTEEIAVKSSQDQESFVRPGGALEAALIRADGTLRSLGQLAGPPRYRQILAANREPKGRD